MGKESIKPMDTARGLSALVTGGALLAYYGGRIYAEAPFQWYKRPWLGHDPYNRSFVRRFAGAVNRTSLERILGVKRHVHGEIPPLCNPTERLVVMGNHPTTNAVCGMTQFVTSHLAPEVAFISKDENLRHPLVGVPGWLSGNLVFIDRSNNEAAIAVLRASCETVLHPGSGICIFPDAHRPTLKRLAEAREKWRPKIGKVVDEFQHTCPPYSGGAFQLLEGTRDVERRVIDLTVGFDRPDATIWDVRQLVGARLHIAVEDVTDEIPKNETDLRVWLVERWIAKNRLLGEWKK